MFYRQSTDNGISWSVPIKVWDWDPLTDSIGCFRGLDLCFSIYNSPGVVFTTSKLTETEFFPGLPSEIRFWSPTVNCGVPKLIADRNNVPFYPNTGNTGDGYLPLCRPVLGRSTLTAMGIWLVAFHASTENTGSDGTELCSNTDLVLSRFVWHTLKVTPYSAQRLEEHKYITYESTFWSHNYFPDVVFGRFCCRGVCNRLTAGKSRISKYPV